MDRTLVGGACAVAVVVLAGCGGARRQSPADPALAVVERVVDGDTVDVNIGGRTERVRLIGIDTPEIAHPASGDRPANTAECFGDEARRLVERLLTPGTEVRLVRDVVPRDDYGRLLAYLHLVDGTLVNLDLVERGLAQPLTIEPNVAHAGALVDAARRAEAAGAGLWRACRTG